MSRTDRQKERQRNARIVGAVTLILIAGGLGILIDRYRQVPSVSATSSLILPPGTENAAEEARQDCRTHPEKPVGEAKTVLHNGQTISIDSRMAFSQNGPYLGAVATNPALDTYPDGFIHIKGMPGDVRFLTEKDANDIFATDLWVRITCSKSN